MSVASGGRRDAVVDRGSVVDLVLAEQSEAARQAVGATVSVAVLIPCRDEASSIARVVDDFRRALPEAVVYVYDNASCDRTAEIAQAAGAIVRFEPVPGKGNVVRRMFAEVDADVYVIVDGDDTYDATVAPMLVRHLVDDGLDMVVGVRREVGGVGAAYRRGHRLGNQTLTRAVRVLFGRPITDMLSGYRVLSRRFVRSFPAESAGFEIETEMTVHALELRLPVDEIPTRYCERGAESASKLRTLRDGVRISRTILMLCREFRPLRFFGGLFALFLMAALALSVPIALGYLETGLVNRLPTVVATSALSVLASTFLICGLVLDSISRSRREMRRLIYLGLGPVPRPVAADVDAGA